jgi:predicted nucleotidyltransferase
MAKIEKPEHIFEELTADLKETLRDDLVSVILFGSGAKKDYIPGKSDINFLIVVSEPAMNRLESISPLVSKWKKRKVATPLVMTQTDLCTSIDSYPVEFLNMERHYRVVFGEDVLAGLKFKPDYIRLQCERELKGKSLLLIQRFFETEGSPRKLRTLIAASITAFISIFNALLFLKGIPIPDNKREVVRETALHYGISLDVFIKCIDIKEGIVDFQKTEIRDIFNSYLRETRGLINRIERLETK